MQIEYRWAAGNQARYAALADELIAMKCDVIVPSGVTLGRVTRSRTSTVPIVSPLWHDTVAEGFAVSLARPGGNVTGTTTMNDDLLAKRIQFLRECLPRMKTLAMVYDPSLYNLKQEIAACEEAAAKYGIRVITMEMTREEDIARTVAEISRQRYDAMLVPAWPLTNSKGGVVASHALKFGIPTIGEPEEFAVAGGFLSYGPDWAALYRRSAYHIDRILRGAKPGDLPIEQPTKFDLVVNLKTAATLGVRVPNAVLARAERIIE